MKRCTECDLPVVDSCITSPTDADDGQKLRYTGGTAITAILQPYGLDGTYGGTGDCVQYATSVGRSYTRIDPRLGQGTGYG